jgi:hypothetical protein
MVLVRLALPLQDHLDQLGKLVLVPLELGYQLGQLE